jgi:ATP-binding cassette subfamily F protein 3
MEPDGLRIVAGNYRTYQQLAARRVAPHGESVGLPAEAARAVEDRREAAGRTDEPPKRKRRFPYRKVADIEEDIFRREAAVEELHQRLAAGETHRDGDLVRRIKGEIAAERAALEALYAHWEEATELNW